MIRLARRAANLALNRPAPHTYEPLPRTRSNSQPSNPLRALSKIHYFLLGFLALILVTLYSRVPPYPLASTQIEHCAKGLKGYDCEPEISHSWGQYSPYFAEPMGREFSKCRITFVQALLRHGSRYPTFDKGEIYRKLVERLQRDVDWSIVARRGNYTFLKDWDYDLGADELTHYGRQEMLSAGSHFFHRYQEGLAGQFVPFVRASGSQRVVHSAQLWVQGYSSAKEGSGTPNAAMPQIDLVIPETEGTNNTLSHNLCTNFEQGTYENSDIASIAQETWSEIFATPIQECLNAALPGANLTRQETIYLMDLCPFTTVAALGGLPTSFCHLFNKTEWAGYDYYQTLGKYYGYGSGNPLGPTQGVGFANELIARLSHTAVNDSTTTNSTLDKSNSTFPLDRRLHVDFTHDNDLVAILSALNLYNLTTLNLTSESDYYPPPPNTPENNITVYSTPLHPLPITNLTTPALTSGFSAAHVVPFGARAYVEKMKCEGEPQEMVRVVVNERLVHLGFCGGGSDGLCPVGAFVEGLEFARRGGRWGECFDDGIDRDEGDGIVDVAGDVGASAGGVGPVEEIGWKGRWG